MLISCYIKKICILVRENYLHGPLKTQSFFLGLENFQLTYLASNPIFDSLYGLPVSSV